LEAINAVDSVHGNTHHACLQSALRRLLLLLEYNIKTMVSVDEIRETLGAWSKRVKPGMVKILGGERWSTGKLPESFWPYRQLLPEVPSAGHHQRAATGKVPDPAASADHAEHEPSLSIHSNDDAYIAKLQESIRSSTAGWPNSASPGDLQRQSRRLETPPHRPRPVHEAVRGR